MLLASVMLHAATRDRFQRLTIKHILKIPADDCGILSAQVGVPKEGPQQIPIEPHNDIFYTLVPLGFISDCQDHLQQNATSNACGQYMLSARTSLSDKEEELRLRFRNFRKSACLCFWIFTKD